MLLPALFALVAAAGWGSADFMAGLLARRLAVLTVLIVSQLPATILLGIATLVRTDSPPAGRYMLYAGLAGLVAPIGIFTLYRGLAVGAMSIVAPISATGVIVPVVAGVRGGEHWSALQAIGIGLAIAGVVTAAATPGGGARGPIAATGTGYALVAAAASGTVLVAVDAASEGDPIWTVLILRVVTLIVFALVALGVRPELPDDRGTVLKLAVVGVLDCLGITMFAIASAEGLLSLVAVLAQMYPVVTVLLARFLLSERVSPRQGAGIVAALAGAGLVTAG